MLSVFFGRLPASLAFAYFFPWPLHTAPPLRALDMDYPLGLDFATDGEWLYWAFNESPGVQWLVLGSAVGAFLPLDRAPCSLWCVFGGSSLSFAASLADAFLPGPPSLLAQLFTSRFEWINLPNAGSQGYNTGTEPKTTN